MSRTRGYDVGVTRAICLFTLLCLCGLARADVAVGDSPELKTCAIDGSTFDLATFRGKLVLVDFWVGRSEPNKQNERKLAELYHDYHDKGLEIVGICCDRRLTDAKRVIEDLKITWTQIHEPADWKGGLGAQWGVKHVNWEVLISPEGKVLFVGDVIKLRPEIESALVKYPPRLVAPEVMKKATADLDAVEALLADKDRDGAVRQFTRIPDHASKDPDFAKRASALRGRINSVADELLAEVDEMLVAKQYPAATARLRELLSTMAGLPTASLARQRLAELVSRPEVQEQLHLAEAEEKAAAALAEARKLRDDNRPEDAYVRFKAVAADYANTKAAASASEAVKAYESDADFLRHMKDRAAAPKAKAALSLADNYVSAGKLDLAKKKYAEVAQQFPGTSYAQTASEKLASLK